MEPQYYYNRYSEYPTKVFCPRGEKQGPENRWSWHPCTFERGLKRFRAACDTESFYHYVVLVTRTKDAVTAREAFADDDWQGFITLTLNTKGIFGDDNKDAPRFVLSIFSDAMASCIDASMAC